MIERQSNLESGVGTVSGSETAPSEAEESNSLILFKSMDFSMDFVHIVCRSNPQSKKINLLQIRATFDPKASFLGMVEIGRIHAIFSMDLHENGWRFPP